MSHAANGNAISGKREGMKAFEMSKASQGSCMEHQNHLRHGAQQKSLSPRTEKPSALFFVL